MDFVKLNLTVLLLTHIMACLWITIGMASDGWVSTFVNLNKDKYEEEYKKETDQTYEPESDQLFTDAMHRYCFPIYVNAAYFILTTITTVGYGDISGHTKYEYLFSMCVEFVGLTFFSLLTGTINVMFSGN